MQTGNIALEGGSGAVPAFAATPSEPGAPRGGVVVVQEAFGVTSHIQDICRRLADSGWTAVAPALFHRGGDGHSAPVLPYGDLASARPLMAQLTAEGISEDLQAALDHLERLGLAPGRCGIVGFCMGGSVAFYAATRWPLGAAVTFYGGGIAAGRFRFPPLRDLAPTLRSPWLGLYGDLDHGIPPGEVEALREAALTAPVPTEVVRYPDAGHGFNCDDRSAFVPAAAADAWKRTLAWLDTHLA